MRGSCIRLCTFMNSHVSNNNNNTKENSIYDLNVSIKYIILYLTYQYTIITTTYVPILL